LRLDSFASRRKLRSLNLVCTSASRSSLGSEAIDFIAAPVRLVLLERSRSTRSGNDRGVVEAAAPDGRSFLVRNSESAEVVEVSSESLVNF